MRIGHYEVHDELARGGMGVIFRATDTRSGTALVLKLLKVDTPANRRRLAREAKAMRRLDHPHVLPLYDAGEHEGEPYLVLPYVEGESLQDRLDRDEAIPVSEVLAIAIQVAEGLEAAHALGLLHRDVKPANVLLDEDGQVKLTDFGLVKDLSPEHSGSWSLSIRGRFLGTPGYWPPEQAFGRLDELSPAADVYALGALIYALLAGRPPRPASTLQEALASVDEPVEALRAHLPLWLRVAVQRSLARDPADRPQLSELRAALETRSTLPPPASQPDEREPAASRVGPRTRVALGALLCLTLVAGVWLLWPVADSPPPASQPDEREQPDSSTAQQVPAQDRRAALGLSRLGGELLKEDELDEAHETFTRALELDPYCAPAHRGLAAVASEEERHEDAHASLSQALEIEPLHAPSYVDRGRCRANLGRLADALLDYDRALELDPKLASAYTSRGVSRREAGDFLAAADDLDRAIQLDPEDPSAYAHRGTVLFELGRPQAGLDDFARALALDPEQPAIYELRAVAQYKLQMHDEVLRDTNQLLRLDPGNVSGYVLRGFTLSHRGELEQALPDFDRALELDPQSALAHRCRGSLLVLYGKPADALGDLDRALELDPGEAESFLYRGVARIRLGRVEDGLADFARAFELQPDSPKAHVARGVCLGELGRGEEALADLERALELAPRSFEAYAERGALFAERGELERALTDFARSAALYEESALPYAYRGLLLAELNLPTQALADLDRAIALRVPHRLRARVRAARAKAAALHGY